MNEYLDPYKQIATGHPDDSYEPGTDKQRIDLTEMYKETQQDDATMMVTGIESMQLGKFSRRVAAHFKLAGYEQYDPFPSERNARAGAEGFFGTIMEGFKTFIENIIKYIRMAVNWVVDTVKGIFGFRKSARINKEINDNLGKMKQEFVTTLSGLGFPAEDYNLENFLQNLPPNQDRVAQLTLLKSKFETDKESIDSLAEALPLLQQCMVKLKQVADRVTKANQSLKVTIGKEYTKVRVRASNPVHERTLETSPEVNRLMKEILEIASILDVDGITSQVSKLYDVLYKVKFSNEELQNGFSECRKKIQDTVVTEVVKLNKQDVPTILATIQYLNARYIEITDNTVDISKIDFKNLATIVDRGESDKITEISNYYYQHQKFGSGFVTLQQAYQQMCVDVRNYTNFCFSVSQSLMVVERQASNLVDWYNRAHAYYYHGLLGDIDTMAKLNLEARKKGHNPSADVEGYPYNADAVFIKGADAKTFLERNAATMNVIVEQDLAGVKTSFNNFAKQTGWGKLV